MGVRKYDIIPTLLQVAQTAVKEKVIRVIVATFRVRLVIVNCLRSNSYAELGNQSPYGQSSSHAGVPTPPVC